MRTLSIRTWLALALLAVVAVPTLAATAVIAAHRPAPIRVQFPEARPDLRQALIESVANWDDPGWQAGISYELAAAGMGLVLADGSGHVVYRAIPVAGDVAAGPVLPGATERVAPHDRVPGETLAIERPLLPGTELVVADGGRRVGTAYLYALPQIGGFLPVGEGRWDLDLWLPTLAQWGSLLAVALAVAWFVDRGLLKPLAAMGRAAHAIAAGDLDVRLPASRVAEVA